MGSDRMSAEEYTEHLRKRGYVPDGKGGFKPATGNEAKQIEFAPPKQLKERVYSSGLNQTIPFKETNPAAFDGLPFRDLYLDEATQWASFDSTKKVITLDIDTRDMDKVAEVYLNQLGKQVNKTQIAWAIKEIRKQEAEDFLMNRHPIKDFYIPGEVRSSKNTMRIMKRRDGSQFIMKGKIATKGEKLTEWDYKGGASAFRNVCEHLPSPLFIKFTFIMSADIAFDFGNLSQGPADQMQKYNWIRNDNRREFVPIYNPIVYIHPAMAGLVISVL